MAILGLLVLGVPPQMSKRLPDGATVFVDAVGSGQTGKVWLPNGGKVGSSRGFSHDEKYLKGFVPTSKESHYRWVLLRVKGVVSDPSVAVRFAGGPARPSIVSWREPGTWLGVFEGNHTADQVALSVGVATSAWTTKGSVAPLPGGKVERKGIGFFRVARPWQDAQAPKGSQIQTLVDVALPTDTSDHEYNVVLFTRQGKSVAWLSRASRTGSQEYKFVVPYEQVGRVELRSRPYRWTTIPGVHLSPKK